MFDLEVLALLLPIVAIMMVGLVFFTWLKTKRDPRRSSKQERYDEIQLIQEIYHGFQRMEERVEALETILLDEGRRSKSSRSGE